MRRGLARKNMADLLVSTDDARQGHFSKTTPETMRRRTLQRRTKNASTKKTLHCYFIIQRLRRISQSSHVQLALLSLCYHSECEEGHDELGKSRGWRDTGTLCQTNISINYDYDPNLNLPKGQKQKIVAKGTVRHFYRHAGGRSGG